MTYKEILSNLIVEAKKLYPDNEEIQDIDIVHIYNHLLVAEAFPSLESINQLNETCINWNDDIYNNNHKTCISILNAIKSDFNDYINILLEEDANNVL